MAQIRVKTLTPVHIGSGNQLQYNSDFIEEKDVHTKERFIQVIDIRKILELIGEAQIEEWLLSIEKKESTKKFMKRIMPDSELFSYSKRRMKCFAEEIGVDDTLKECLHNGLGLPYVPGSSLKGAIRTAVFTSLVKEVNEKEKKILFRGEMTASVLEKELFGSIPNTDIFRFIHVGDVYFDKNTEMVLRSVMYLNISKNLSLQSKSGTSQLIEAIAPNNEAICQLDIKKDYYNWVREKYPELNSPFKVNDINKLFGLINAHTRKLVQDEVNIWVKLNETYSGAGSYIDNMKAILDEINNCQDGKECVLRVWNASGWRFTTGAWGETLTNFKDVIAASRPNNSYYEEYDFPKSRKASEKGGLLGFIKLTIEKP